MTKERRARFLAKSVATLGTSSQYSTLRPTRLDEIKNFHLDIHAGTIESTQPQNRVRSENSLAGHPPF